eukprot:11983527-Alexandrium_andersonii.AAC.1
MVMVMVMMMVVVMMMRAGRSLPIGVVVVSHWQLPCAGAAATGAAQAPCETDRMAAAPAAPRAMQYKSWAPRTATRRGFGLAEMADSFVKGASCAPVGVRKPFAKLDHAPFGGH